jgi:hypothetical protein
MTVAGTAEEGPDGMAGITERPTFIQVAAIAEEATIMEVVTVATQATPVVAEVLTPVAVETWVAAAVVVATTIISDRCAGLDWNKR